MLIMQLIVNKFNKTQLLVFCMYPGFCLLGGGGSSSGIGGRYGSNLAPGITAPLSSTHNE